MFFQSCFNAIFISMAVMALASFIVRGIFHKSIRIRRRPKKWGWRIFIGLVVLTSLLYFFQPYAETISQMIGVGFFSMAIYMTIQAIKF